MLNNNKKQETQFFGTKCGNANSIAAGYATETTNYGEIATGILNKSTKGNNPNSPEGIVGDPKATLFSVGCGTKGERKNALEIKGDGSVIISGKDGSDVIINDLSEYVKSNEIYQCIKKEYDSTKRGKYAIAIDDSAIASGRSSTAIGVESNAKYNYSVAIGCNAVALGSDAVVIGVSSSANNHSVAIGTSSNVKGHDGIALGFGSNVSKNYAIAIGKNAKNNKSIFSVGFDGVNGIDMDADNYGLYLKGFGGYTGTNLTVINSNVETLNPNIKSVQEIINNKSDLTPIVTPTNTTISLQPNKKYEITVGDTLVLTFTEPSDKTHKNEYLFSINTESSVSTITFPIEIIWDVEPVIAANKHYEINVQYSQGKYWGTVHTWNIPS